jgi:signal transduction histidine kinase
LLGKILLAISVVFSIWGLFSLITWTGFDSRIISFVWSFFEVLSILFFFLVLYFVYVFIEKKDVSFKIKIVFLILFLPVIIISSTKKYLTGFDIVNCEAIENSNFLYYIYILKALAFVGTLSLLIFEYFAKFKNDKLERSKVVLIGMGALLLLLSFLTTQYFANLIFGNYEIEFYGLFAITVFMGFLAYMIVKFKAFDIKLIGAQALVVALIVLIGSQFFFIQNNTNRILTGITLALAVGFGWFLIKSIKAEVQRKEELQKMSDALAKANDQLKKLDNAKSDFISIASHQLRTPLTSIKGFISLLSEGSYGKITPVQQETLNKVYQSNERLIHLVEDLLDISRIESGRMEFDFAPCQVANLCQEVVDGFALRAKNNKLYLDYKKPDVSLPEIMIDAGKVREVISNMVDNALKYTPKGGVKVSLEQKETNLRVTISDTGIGIPVTELPYLFSKFSRGKDIGRLNAAGTGLGLYVGKSMIEANGGKIWAESEGEGQGSRFIIELPLQQSKEILEQWGK